MPTGLQLFDLSNLGASVKGQKTVPGAAKPAIEGESDQLAGFMEIMSALLALPPEQWKHSLAGLEAACPNRAGAAWPGAAGNSGRHMPPLELLKLIMNMKGEALQQLRSANAQGDPQSLLALAETLMEDPQAAATGEQDAAGARAAQGAPAETLSCQSSQIEGAAQIVRPAEPGKVAENRPLPGMDPGTGSIGNPLDSEAAIDGEIAAPVVQPAVTSRTSREADPAEDFLSKAFDAQTEGAAKPSPDEAPAKLAPATAMMSSEDTAPDEQGRSDEKAHPMPLAEGAKNMAANARPQVEGESFEERLALKPETSVAGHQGQLWRAETGQQVKGLSASGGKEVMGEEKTAASDVIRQIVQRMSMQTIGAQSKMVIRLKPEFLGNVQMQVVTENHQVTVRMMADSTLVKDIVEQNLPHLKAELQHHGLEIQKFDVFVANDDQGWRGGQERAGFRDARNQRQPRSGDGNAKNQRGKVTFDTGQGRKNVQMDTGEINYFA